MDTDYRQSRQAHDSRSFNQKEKYATVLHLSTGLMFSVGVYVSFGAFYVNSLTFVWMNCQEVSVTLEVLLP